MALLKRRDLLETTGMGGSERIGTHEQGRSNARQSIFPTGSPVALGQKKKPKLLSAKSADSQLSKIGGKLRSLIEARKQANEVYGDTYFENHYPNADKDLKTAIDKKLQVAHSRLNAKDVKEQEKEAPHAEPHGGVTIVLNIGV